MGNYDSLSERVIIVADISGCRKLLQDSLMKLSKVLNLMGFVSVLIYFGIISKRAGPVS